MTPPLYYVDRAINNDEETTVAVSLGYDLFTRIIGVMLNTFGQAPQLFSFESGEEWHQS